MKNTRFDEFTQLVFEEKSTTTIWSCIDTKHGKLCICKQVNALVPSKRRMILKEVDIMRNTSHHNIVELVQFRIEGTVAEIYMEYCGSSLFEIVSVQRNSTESKWKGYMVQITNAIDYLHKNNITHRDVKLENICVLDGHIRLIDFGLSHQYDHEELEVSLSHWCGTAHYCCPEICNKIVYSGYAADIWSCGIVFYSMFMGSFPFDKASHSNNVFVYAEYAQSNGENIVSYLLSSIYQRSFYMKPSLLYLLDNMLQTDPNKRCDIQGVIHSEYMKSDMIVDITNEQDRRTKMQKTG